MLDHLDHRVIWQGVLVTTNAYWLVVVFYTLIPRLFPGYAARYKLQADGKPLPERTNIWLMLLTLFNQTLLIYGFFAIAGEAYFRLGGRFSLSFPAWYMVIFHFVLYAVTFEVLFYAAHRLLHIRRLYRWVHALHHRFRSPVPYSGACVHPIEFMLAYIIPNILPAVLFNFSFPEYLLFLSIEYMHNVHDHCGYHFPWDPFALIFGQNSRMHDEHHRLYQVNYSGAFTMVLDRLFKTYYDPAGEKR